MPLAGYQEMPLRQFSGLQTLTDPTNLPVFASPDCQNMEFFPGEVKTRPGFQSILPAFNLAGFIKYVKTYITGNINDQIRMLTIDNFGNFCKEDVSLAPGSQILISGEILFNSLANSVSLFGREYLAIGDGQYGYDIPRQYDDVNLDRIGLTGPGQAPVAVDENLSFALLASPNGAQMLPAQSISVSEVGNVVTVNQALPGGIRVGDSVIIAGIAVGGYNGTFVITASNPAIPNFQYYNSNSGLAPSGPGTADFMRAQYITSAATNFVVGQQVIVSGVAVGGYNGTFEIREVLSASVFHMVIGVTGLGNSGNGTMVPKGNVDAGTHQITVIWQTRSGYQSAPAPPRSVITAGGKRLILSAIPIGPSNVVARIICATPISSASFFYVPGSSMVINDNTSTTATIDFSDVQLLNGTNIDGLFDLIVLPRCSGITTYSSRIVAWGCVNNVKNFLNMDFDGGFIGNAPCGWSVDATNGAGITRSNGVTGDGYRFTADANAAHQGMILQGAVKDYLNNPILTGGTLYTIYARIKGGGSQTGTINIRLQSSIAGYDQGIAVSPNFNFLAYTAACAVLPNPIPSDLVLKLFVTGAIAGDTITIDDIELYPTSQPVETDVVRFSFPEDAESFDGLTGFIQPTQANGQAVRNCFVLRDFLYIDKERSRFVTRDDGQNEPNVWQVEEVSGQVGSVSIRGTGIGDEWSVTASKSGLWFFTGAQLTDSSNFAKEIQPTWDSINWALGYLIDVKVDTTRKRIYVDVPLGNTLANNKKLTLDYTEGFADPVSNDGVGRKWCPWTSVGTSQNMVLRQNGLIFLVNGVQGKVVEQVEGVLNDDGLAIDNFWQSGFFQDKQRLNWSYVSMNIVGAGTCNLILRKNSQFWTKIIRGWLLNIFAFGNKERQIQMQGERMAIRIGINAVNQWFSCQGIVFYAQTATYAPVRGTNAST